MINGNLRDDYFKAKTRVPYPELGYWRLPSSIRPIFVAVTIVLLGWVVLLSTPIREQGLHCVWNACDAPLPCRAPWTKCTCPTRVLLRLNSRERVDWLVPTIRAISFLGNFLCSKAKICDLCSEVSCLYIGNTKIINLGESSKRRLLFCIAGIALRGCAPRPRGKPAVFFMD